jgi:hypothetical protein
MNLTRSLNHFFLIPVLCALGFAAAPALRAETPPEQVKDAGAIKLTTDLLDKMDAFISAVGADAAAKAELEEIGKDPAVSKDQDAWAAAITSKCPKTSEHLKKAGLSGGDFTKGISAIMACAMSEDMANSDNATAKANAEFVTANKERAEKIFGSFMELNAPAEKK